MKFYKDILSNGLTLIGEQRETAVSTAIGFFVRTGARDESSEVSGVSHFLEHMMFKGTDKRSALDITYDMGAIGAQANAYTSEEATVYYMAVLPEYLKDALELLSDMMRPALRQEDFDVEKNVILEEIALYQDRPSFMLFESSLREFFSDHPAGNSVLGSHASVSTLSSEQMKKYFDSRYVASNIVFVCTGNFDWEQVKSMVNEYCAKWPKGEATRSYPEFKPKIATKVITKQDINRAHLCLMGLGPSAKDEFRYDAEVLANILGDSAGSKLYWELIDKGLADSASVGSDNMDGVGMSYAYVSCSPDKIDKITEITRNVLKNCLDFSTSELERALNKIRTRLVLQSESSMRRLMSVGNDWLFRAQYSSLEEQQSRYTKVTMSTIKDLLKIYDFEPKTEVRLLPKN